MAHREVLEPSAGHPITIEPTKGRVQVRINGELVADTTAALVLQEATLPAVQYIPLADVAQDRLTRTDTATYCPFKGDASYYSVTTSAGDTVEDAIWYVRRALSRGRSDRRARRLLPQQSRDHRRR